MSSEQQSVSRLQNLVVWRRLWNGIRSVIYPVNAVTRFGNDTLWSTVGNVAMQSLSFCSTLIIARLLTKEEFGQYALLLSSILLLGTLAGLGLGVAISKTAAELRDSAPDQLGSKLAAAYWIGAVMTLCLTAVIVIGWAALGDNFVRLRLNPYYVVLVVAAFTTNTASMLQAAELTGYQNFRGLALTQCIRGVVLLPLSVTAAVFFRLPGVIGAAAAATGIMMLAQGAMLSAERKKRAIAVRGRPRWRELRSMLSDSVPAFVIHVSNAAGSWGGNVAVALCGAAGIGAVAEFGAASQVLNMILFLPNIIGQVLMPTVANMKTTQRREGRRLVRLGVAASTGAAVLWAVVIVSFRRQVALLFGPTYAEASATVALIAIAGVIYVAQSTMSHALIGYGHIRSVCLASVIAAVAFSVLAGVLIKVEPRLGSQSLGWACILASTVRLAVVVASARRFGRRRVGVESCVSRRKEFVHCE